jgi:CBS domain containing-hemolysin-like protein
MRFEVVDVDHYRIDQLLVKRLERADASPLSVSSLTD